MEKSRFAKVILFVNALVPLTLLLWDWRRGQLGANPVEFLTRTTGMMALIFLLLGLAVTPLRKITGESWLIKVRRMTGLFAFFYGTLHLLTYLAFDRAWKLTTVPGDVWQRPFIAFGMTAFLILVPLAITSTNAMIKRLGRNWATLHKGIYVAGTAGVLHYYLLVKSDLLLPLTFALVLILLLGWRVYTNNQKPTPRPQSITR